MILVLLLNFLNLKNGCCSAWTFNDGTSQDTCYPNVKFPFIFADYIESVIAINNRKGKMFELRSFVLFENGSALAQSDFFYIR